MSEPHKPSLDQPFCLGPLASQPMLGREVYLAAVEGGTESQTSRGSLHGGQRIQLRK